MPASIRRAMGTRFACGVLMHHAAVWIDQHEAHIFDVGAETFARATVEAPRHHLHRRHPSTVDHAHPSDLDHFFREVASVLSSANEILIVGPASAKHELMRYFEKHDRPLVGKVVGVETVDHPSDKQLASYARKYFKVADALR